MHAFYYNFPCLSCTFLNEYIHMLASSLVHTCIHVFMRISLPLYSLDHSLPRPQRFQVYPSLQPSGIYSFRLVVPFLECHKSSVLAEIPFLARLSNTTMENEVGEGFDFNIVLMIAHRRRVDSIVALDIRRLCIYTVRRRYLLHLYGRTQL